MADYDLSDSQIRIVINGPKEVILLDDDSNPGRAPSCRISLKFACKLKEQYWDAAEENATGEELEISYYEEIKDLPDIHVDFEISNPEISEAGTYRKVFGVLSDALITECGVPVCDGEYFAGSFIERFREILDCTPRLTKMGSITFPIDLELIYSYRRVLPELTSDDGYNSMIPTSYTTIKSLEKKRLEDYEDSAKTREDCCTICLDDIERDSEVCILPCSHVFHGDCIIEWLNTSHYCPICRFEMPTQESNKVCSID